MFSDLVFPKSDLPKTAIDIDVDWEECIAEVPPLLLGANDYRVTNLKTGANSLMHDRVRKLGLRMMRIRYPHLSSILTDSVTHTWDEEALKETLDPFFYGNAHLALNIPTWPAWMKQDHNRLLDPSEYRNYAQFCARLVGILNLKLRLEIEYWEPLGTLVTRYQHADQLQELWKIFNIVSTAMRLKDPRIKIGGPSSANYDTQIFTSFLQYCRFNVDFVCWNDYSFNSIYAPTEKLMAATPDYFQRVRTLQSMIRQAIPNRHVSLLLSEYNIDCGNSQGKQDEHIGAVWFASVMKHLVESGLDMAAISKFKDATSGLIGRDDRFRPIATVFVWLHQYLMGQVYATTSTQASVEVLATRQNNQNYRMLLINKSANDEAVRLQPREILMSPQIEVLTLDRSGIDRHYLPSIDLYRRDWIVPAHSLRLLLFTR
jgi:Glycosyl hydrolases family 39